MWTTRERRNPAGTGRATIPDELPMPTEAAYILKHKQHFVTAANVCHFQVPPNTEKTARLKALSNFSNRI